jgi:methionyl-tRNA formyltransferase
MIDRVVFMGTPHFAVPALRAIAEKYKVVGVYTQPDRPVGRGLELTASPVKKVALELGIPVSQPEKLSSPGEFEKLQALQPDVIVVAAYGQILKKNVLDLPKLGCLNIHSSLLPRWRGAAPIHWAILAGDPETGITTMKMAEGLDTGPVGMVEKLAITPNLTAGEAHDRLAVLGADVMIRALAALSRGGLSFVGQASEGVEYAKKITNEECRIDWSLPSATVHNQVRGLSPFPGAFTFAEFGKGPERLKILRTEKIDLSGTPGTVLDDTLAIACGDGAVRLLEVQRAGSKPMAAVDFLRGSKLTSGMVVG